MDAFSRLAPHLAAASAARPWFERHLPEPLLREGPRDLLWWQWLALPLAALLAVLAGYILSLVARRLLGHLLARTATIWGDLLLERLARPITAICALGAGNAILPSLALPPGAEEATGQEPREGDGRLSGRGRSCRIYKLRNESRPRVVHLTTALARVHGEP